MEDNRSLSSRVVLGIVLIVIGGLFLLRTGGIISLDIPRIIFSFPFILTVGGVLIIANSRKRTFGVIVFIFGVFLLIPRIFPYIYYDDDIIIPIVIILVGAGIIFRQRTWKSKNIYHANEPIVDDAKEFGKKFADGIKHRSYNWEVNKDYIDDVSIFGGGHKVIHSDNFKGGNITAIFGGSEIDLTQCKLAEGDNVLDVVIIFGGTEIIVPKDWNVRMNVTPLFGGFSNKTRREYNQPLDQTRTLLIKGIALFGGGELKAY
jgi:predicted membrane protein